MSPHRKKLEKDAHNWLWWAKQASSNKALDTQHDAHGSSSLTWMTWEDIDRSLGSHAAEITPLIERVIERLSSYNWHSQKVFEESQFWISK